jgi:integrase
MSLTDVKIRNAKPTEKPRKLYDSGGLYAEIAKSGATLWRFKYRYDGKEKRLALGRWPDVSLADARRRRDEARKLLANDIDPAQHRRAAKQARSLAAENSFRATAEEWFDRQAPKWTEANRTKVQARLTNDVYPKIGDRPITEITPADVLAVLLAVEGRGAGDTARRVAQDIRRIFAFGVAMSRCTDNPCAHLHLRDALAPIEGRNFAAITDPVKVGELLRAIDGFMGSYTVKCALQLAPLVFVRPGELRKMQWAHIDFDTAEWSIPAEFMKMKQPHLVPLSRQAVEILRKLEPYTRHRSDYVFPCMTSAKKPMSEAALAAALRRLGYSTKDDITPHGFRAMARTLLHEQLRYKPEIIEHQLAHRVADALGSAYNRTRFFKERAAMMQEWSCYLDKLKAGAEVVPFPGKTSF